MHLSFHVFGLKARVEPEAGGNETVAVRFQEFGTHHTFVARFRDPVLFMEMVAQLQEIVKRKGWDVNPPRRRQDALPAKGQPSAPQEESAPQEPPGPAPDAEQGE